MSKRKSRYHCHRFPPAVISYAIWAYHRFCLSFRDVEELLAQRGVIVPYESIRRWCFKFGRRFRRSLKSREGHPGDTWHVDEVFIRIQGKVHYLWRAVDQDGDVIEILVQNWRDAKTARRFFKKALKGQGAGPIRLTTDGLRSYPSAAREVLPEAHHDTSQYANDRADVSHQPSGPQERQMRRFKSRHQAQRSPVAPRSSEQSVSLQSPSHACIEPPDVPCQSIFRLAAGDVPLTDRLDREVPHSLWPHSDNVTVPRVALVQAAAWFLVLLPALLVLNLVLAWLLRPALFVARTNPCPDPFATRRAARTQHRSLGAQ